jgi:hypothetical protein
MAQPVCGSECQKEKQLSGLLLAMQSSNDPQAYEKARIQYYTLKDGQGWLRQEKERLARAEVAPVLTKLSAQYDNLKAELAKRTEINKYIQMTQAQKITDENRSAFLTKSLKREKDKVDVATRLSELGGGAFTSSWMPIVLDVIIGVLGLYLAYTVFNKVRSRFSVS